MILLLGYVPQVMSTAWNAALALALVELVSSMDRCRNIENDDRMIEQTPGCT